jgi:hypothetical protein
MPGKETLADQIRILAKQGLKAAQIAKEIGCTANYAAWVIWREKNKTKHRKWEANYRRDQYNTKPEVRTRVLDALKKNRSKRTRVAHASKSRP